MTYDEAIEYIHGVSWTFCRPGLERIRELTERLESPERDLRFVHVAGTNGKGSFCSMLAEVLTASGYKTGLFTSPYVVRFNERMRIDGADIGDDELAELTEEIRPIAESMTDRPTEFELITALAFLYFKRRGVDVVVLEAGMGGRLDSTNVIPPPLLSVITGISLDHTAFLGTSTEEIAREKAGIIKHPSPVLFGGADPVAERVIRARAEELECKYRQTEREAVHVTRATLEGTDFDYLANKDLHISLLGTYQPYNAANVIEAVELLREGGLEIPHRCVREGLARAVWRARFEVIGKSPLTVFDGAHNAEGIASAAESIRTYIGRGAVAVTGVLADKEYEKIAATLAGVVCAAYTLTPNNPRALSAGDYAEVLRTHGVEAHPCLSIDEAVEAALDDAERRGTAVVCLGSLYTYREVVSARQKYRRK